MGIFVIYEDHETKNCDSLVPNCKSQTKIKFFVANLLKTKIKINVIRCKKLHIILICICSRVIFHTRYPLRVKTFKISNNGEDRQKYWWSIRISSLTKFTTICKIFFEYKFLQTCCKLVCLYESYHLNENESSQLSFNVRKNM